MKLAVITPVGPGHERYVDGLRKRCSALQHIVVDDTDGALGRSKARNMGMRRSAPGTDWFFFLDADDELAPGFESAALAAIDCHGDKDVILGSLGGLNDKGEAFGPAAPHRGGAWRCLTKMPARFCISGLFRADLALGHEFLEGMDKGEDVEFVLSLCAAGEFELQAGLFTRIRCDRPSSGGPRGYESLDWGATIQPIMFFWKRRGPHPMGPGKRVPGYWRKR